MLGDAIRAARKEKGYSQDECAERFGVSRQAFSNWETNKATPKGNNIIALIVDLNISPNALDDRAHKSKDQ